MKKLSVHDMNFKDKRVLLRVDFNVPLDDTQQISDDTRIRETVPTIKKILHDGGRCIVMSHLGRPKGKKNPAMSLKPCSVRLGELLGHAVQMAPDCIGTEVEAMAAQLKNGEALMLENLRFYNDEEANDPEFARKLAGLGDIYVNDAFGTAHRAHASTEGVTKFFKQNLAGYLMEQEIRYLGMHLQNPHRPFVAIIGGAKVSGKIDVIDNLMKKVDALIIGGGMMFTFAKMMGYEIGKSLFESEKAGLAKEIIENAKSTGKRLIFPVDCVVANEVRNDADQKVVAMDSIPSGWVGVDIGPKTIELFRKEIVQAKTVVWNGPMGIFEMENFAKGTRAVAEALVDCTNAGGVTIIGGGDSAAAITDMGMSKLVSHVSTGGGASLEFLEGKVLPGLDALTNA